METIDLHAWARVNVQKRTLKSCTDFELRRNAGYGQSSITDYKFSDSASGILTTWMRMGISVHTRSVLAYTGIYMVLLKIDSHPDMYLSVPSMNATNTT
jgi:hypothetical protein